MIAGVVLAAGSSRRMGESKLLLPWGGGSTIIRTVVDALQAGGMGPVVVVVGAEREGVEVALQGSGAVIAPNPDSASGDMLGSIKVGLRGLPPEVEAAGIMPGDLPRVRSSTVAALVTAWNQGARGIIAPVHGGRRGHPVLMPREAWPEVTALGPEDSLRTYLRRQASQILAVEVDDPGIHADIDTPADYDAADAGRGGNDSR